VINLRLLKECSCNYKGKNCKHIGHLLNILKSLENEYGTEHIKELKIVSSVDYGWSIIRTTGYIEFSLAISCDVLKESSSDKLRKILICAIEDDDYEGSDELECTGDCHGEDMECKDCRCPRKCCAHCGDPCYGDCHNEDTECENCRCPSECCENCGDPCYGDCQDEDISCKECRCPEECCGNCNREQEEDNGYYYLNPEEKIRAVARRIGLSDSCEIIIKDDNSINGCTDGKKIWVNSGAISQLPEEEMAFLLSHEQSHIEGDHVGKTEELIKRRIEKIETIFEDKKTGLFKKTLKTIGSGLVGIGEFSAMSHMHELEADKNAKRKTQKVGYSGNGGEDLLDRFNVSDRGFSITHPHPKTRKDNLK
jgi:hypothetical protein